MKNNQDEKKIHWKKVFDSNYLGTCDLDENKDIDVVIDHVEIRKIKNTQGKEDERNVALFTDKNIKPMILNVTNCKTIRSLSGSPFIQDWKGVSVNIYVQDNIRAFNEVTDGLRIREPQVTERGLETLLALKKDKLTEAEYKRAETIIKTKEKNSYRKLQTHLRNK